MNTIMQLHNTMEQIRLTEVGRHAKKINTQEAEVIDQVTKSFIDSLVSLIAKQSGQSEEKARHAARIFSRE